MPHQVAKAGYFFAFSPFLMRKDATEVHTRPHGLVQAIGVDGKHPVGLEHQSQGLAHDILNTHVRIYGKEGLLVEHGIRFGHPIVLVALEHEEGGLHASAQRGAYEGYHSSALPEEVGQHARPEEFVVAAALYSLADGGGREVALKAGAEVVGEVQLGASSDAERGTANLQPEGVVAPILVAAVHHHAAREAFDELALLGRCAHYATKE